MALKLEETEDIRKRKILLAVSVVSNLGILGFFKYFGFFTASFQNFLSYFGLQLQSPLLHIILPVGISFYTFQSLSYTIDVYRKELKATKNFFDFSLFVTYFPQLVAGPIERATHLLPQVLSPRKIRLDQFYEGCYLIFWGLFQKVFVADNLAKIVDPVFKSAAPYNGISVLIALYAFAFQIYCDFAGYSNIARGLGKCMGFDIMVNFNLPYITTNPTDFWHRWHISLSTWLRDYLYIPLGGNRKGLLRTYRNVLLTMLLGGLWHGANWTFVIWGTYHGILLIIHRFFKPQLAMIPEPRNIIVRKTWFMIRVIFFFHLVCLGWLMFRAQSLNQLVDMLKAIAFNFNLANAVSITSALIGLGFFIWFLLLVQLKQYFSNDLMAVYKGNPVFKAAFYVVCFYLILIWGVTGGKEFIYFQF
jgi:D-alanyl-lipoteichoic acid acyltransferase DltB (MBOAT superfamily)